jgi:hypothetical protein
MYEEKIRKQLKGRGLKENKTVDKEYISNPTLLLMVALMRTEKMLMSCCRIQQVRSSNAYC